MTTSTEHAEAIRALPRETRVLVLLALTARAMDFVSDRLNDDGGDEAADVVREFFPGEDEFPHAAHDRGFFNPDDWHTTNEMVEIAVDHDRFDVEAWTEFMERI